MAPYALDWLKKRFGGTGGTNDVDYGSSIVRGGGRPPGFNTAKYDGYMDDDNEVAMTPGQLLGAVRGASNFLNPNAPPPDWAQKLNDRIFPPDRSYSGDGNYGNPANQHPGGREGAKRDLETGLARPGGGVYEAAIRGLLDKKRKTYWGGPR